MTNKNNYKEAMAILYSYDDKGGYYFNKGKKIYPNSLTDNPIGFISHVITFKERIKRLRMEQKFSRSRFNRF